MSEEHESSAVLGVSAEVLAGCATKALADAVIENEWGRTTLFFHPRSPTARMFADGTLEHPEASEIAAEFARGLPPDAQWRSFRFPRGWGPEAGAFVGLGKADVIQEAWRVRHVPFVLILESGLVVLYVYAPERPSLLQVDEPRPPHFGPRKPPQGWT